MKILFLSTSLRMLEAGGRKLVPRFILMKFISVKVFLQPIKLLEISIMMTTLNYLVTIDGTDFSLKIIVDSVGKDVLVRDV